ncbi:HEAT repeat domain-containing protein [Catellatospora vulcania]|uniref:HEAT repeat domain-containing protein n=1 Tax=Catellatospora vulcania TaxID=1460450 RepID=UPI0012D3A878|nr:HEAT repeat domain-containing protein [Catellatospora vulcania]
MTTQEQDTNLRQALRGLAHRDPSVRLRAALAVGTTPDARSVAKLIERCAVEPEFYVREMLTWALTRQPPPVTVPILVDELRSEYAQARSQALHTLSKIGDRRAWPAITRALLTDPDDTVAQSAWRAAVVLVPEGGQSELAAVLATQLGRGGRETQLSLSRALIALGEVIMPIVHAASTDRDSGVRRHALATRQLWLDPDAGFQLAVEQAKRVAALGAAGEKG